MALTYDIRSDIRFKEGKEEGKEETLTSVIQNLLTSNLSQEQIAQYLKVPVEMVKKIAKSMKK